ncbi:unnamed protein product [Sphenostylis stenocarpa]|uniref:F-box protein At3g26010-like beta-propeller domain-containing protein n=1 Tax=Sphenostylis stenocarpa TaxID=92480 RepID=A0AA86RWG9_9FABA|nr:unnamed protein product [Sphenostylis stenocarpa]
MALSATKMLLSKPTSIEEISEDILAEILHRMPFTSCLPLLFSNKRFMHLISQSEFLKSCRACLLLSPREFKNQNLFILFQFWPTSLFAKKILLSIDSNNKTHSLNGCNFLPLSWPQDRDQVVVKATHHDLLLCCTHNNSHFNYFVCNPFTKQHVVLPPLRRSHSPECPRIGFMFDQSRSRFWVVHVPLMLFKMIDSFQINMFSSETGEWSACNVPVPYSYRVSMFRNWYRNILVYNGKFIWWIDWIGFLECDPSNGREFKWETKKMNIRYSFRYADENCDIYNGISNGRVKICQFLKKDSVCKVRELEDYESGIWRSSDYDGTRLGIKDMNFLTLHPFCEYIMYFYSKDSIFVCDFKNGTLQRIYTIEGERIVFSGQNALSFVLPEWPTPLPSLSTAKVSETRSD